MGTRSSALGTVAAVRGGVLFDLDGTIVDREPLAARAVAEVLSEQGHRVGAADLVGLVGRSWPDIHAALDVEAAVGWTRETFTEAVVERSLELGRAVRWRPLRGCTTLIEVLGTRGVGLAVVTGSSRREAEAVLGSLGIVEDFAVVVGVEDYDRGKPDAQPYEVALSRLGSDPVRSVAVEDSDVGVRSALAAGLRVVAVGAASSDEGGSRPGAARPCADLAAPELVEWVLGVVGPPE